MSMPECMYDVQNTHNHSKLNIAFGLIFTLKRSRKPNKHKQNTLYKTLEETIQFSTEEKKALSIDYLCSHFVSMHEDYAKCVLC